MPRFRTFALAAGLLAAPAWAGQAWATDVKARVSGVDSRGGEMRIEVCTRETFLKTCPYRAKAPARQGTTEVLVKNVPPGSYAVVAHHDINGNGEVDRTMLGVPKEGVGFSRGPMLILRAPTFDETSLPVSGALVAVDIALKFEP